MSDQVPPDQVQHRRELLSGNGRVLEITEKAKTKEQLELEARLEQLKKAQEKIIAKQQSNDRALLSTYRSVEDMNIMLGQKMKSLDYEHNVLLSNLNQFQIKLENLLKQASTLERNGEKIPQSLLDQIAAEKNQIQTIQEDIEKQLRKQKIAKAEFEADIKRYKYLTQYKEVDARKLSDQSSNNLAADSLGLYQCQDDTVCEKAWLIAHLFVKTYSTTKIDADTEQLVMTQKPIEDEDLSLSVSRMDAENQKKQLFLDIRCRQSSLGNELCKGQKVKSIRTYFRSFIEAGLIDKKN